MPLKQEVRTVAQGRHSFPVHVCLVCVTACARAPDCVRVAVPSIVCVSVSVVLLFVSVGVGCFSVSYSSLLSCPSSY